MRRTIPCFCDNTFTVDVPEEIDLDKDPQYIEDIIAGNFMNFVCSACGKKHKPEFPLAVLWQSKALILEVQRELDRGSFYRGKAAKKSGPLKKETVIGYPELAERVAMLKDGLIPEAVEGIKYFLFLKADEACPEGDISVWYHGTEGNSGQGGDLLFHIHGIRENEIAQMKVPAAVYEKTLKDFRKKPKEEPFASLRVKNYFSIRNLTHPDEMK